MSKTFANVLYVFAADIVVKLITASTTFFLATLLGPAEYGVWITLFLVVSYAPIVSLGSVETLVKQYPFYVGKGDEAAAIRVERAVLGSIVVASVVLVAGGFAVSMFLSGTLTADVLRLVRVMLLTAGLTFLSAFSLNRFIAHQRFDFLSLLNGLRAVVTFVCLVSMTRLWGLPGSVAGLIAAELVICMASWRLCSKHCGKLTASYDPSAMWEVIKIGFPITVIWWAFIIQSTADRLISIALLGQAATGFYGLGSSIVTLVILLPVTLSRVLYPKVNEKVGESLQQHDLRALVMKPSQALSVVVPATIGLLIIASPILYKQVLPKYNAGLCSAQILLLGSFFVCIVRTGMNYLIATNRQRTVLTYVLSSMLINVLGNIILVKSGFGIEGIALGSGISACFLATLVWLSVFKHLGSVRQAQIKQLGVLYLPFVLMLSLLGLYGVLVPGGINNVAPQGIVACVLFIVTFSTMVCAIPTMRTVVMELVTLLRTSLARVAA